MRHDSFLEEAPGGSDGACVLQQLLEILLLLLLGQL